MSIPLDRLYNFLDGANDHNLIIYGWKPHGSKKIQDLKILFPVSESWRVRETQPGLIFHDQEPLDYDFSQSQVEKEFHNVVKGRPDLLMLTAPLVEKFYKKMNLRSVLEAQPGFFDLCMIVHSEKNSTQTVKFEQNNYVPVYYWSHAIIARDWFRFAEHDHLLNIKISNPKTFLIYNRAWGGSREYRLKFTEQLIESKLHEDCVTSFAEFDEEVHYSQHVFKNTDFKINRLDLEKILLKNIYSSESSADYVSSDYQNSMIEVVLETLFDDQRNHLTEKTLRPIACGQPFILASTAGSLQYLRDYGFKTFNGLIDESYDDIQDPGQRLQCIIHEMQRISNLPTQQKQQLTHDLQPICNHNWKLFFSKDFHDHIITEFNQNLNNAIVKVKSGPAFNTRQQLRQLMHDNYPDLFYKYVKQDSDDLLWAEEWLSNHIKLHHVVQSS